MTARWLLQGTCLLLIMALVIAAGCTGSSGTVPDHKAKAPATVKPAPSRAGSSPAATVTPATAAVRVISPAAVGPVAPLLGRPTDHSVNVNLLPSGDLEVFLKYRNATGPELEKTDRVTVRSGVPENILITGLAPDTAYQYQVCWKLPDAPSDTCSSEYSFHTARSPGSSFVFAVQADSHLDDRASGALYNQTLANELAASPDFLIDLGDTSMSEKLPAKTEDAIRDRYLLQRSYFGTIGHSVPLFLVLGNHDGESGYALAGKDNSLARMSLQFRKLYFPGPEPDGFYTGNAEQDAAMGLKQDYYAWQWGDALFIVLDPYWYTTTKPGGNTDGWAWTLGRKQYDWLQQTLATKKTNYTFVFAHHLVGGDPQGRGGTEFASLYEWGGKNADGTEGFSQQRPGWGMPIHQLFVKYNVTAFFHGHDHIFAKQELDGITYQEVPQPATVGSPNPGAEYGYVSGVLLQSPGYLKITVAPDSARVEYISSAISGESKNAVKNGAVEYSYTLTPSPASAEG